MRRAALAAILALGAFSARAGADTCPSTAYWFFPPFIFHTTAASKDTSSGLAFIRFNTPRGEVLTTASAGPSDNASGNVDASDEYVIVGPLSPNPISFSARLHLTGDAESFNDGFYYGAAAAWGVLREGTANRDSFRVDAISGGTTPLDHTLEISLQHMVAEPFQLVFGSHTGCYLGFARADGQLSFVLPPGYLVSSCQGYLGDGSVSARGVSWGSIKTRYR